jgi:transcriptional regulator with XRE-family HTH domain
MSDACPYCNGTGVVEATLASRLTALRNIKGVRQEEVADAARVSRAQIANLERGRGEPSISSLMLLASYFDVTTDYLLGRAAEVRS